MVGPTLCRCIYFESAHLPAGGSLVLAEGGVCLVGNLSCHKTEMKDKLQHSM